MKILIINPPINDFFFTPQRAFPLGTLSLATVLDYSGISVKVLNCLEDYTKQSLAFPKRLLYLKRYYQPNRSAFSLFSHYYCFGKDVNEISETICREQPDMVGISANFTAYLDNTFAIAKLVKKIDSKISVVVGGRAATADAKFVLGQPEIDFVIKGEAEQSFLKLCQAQEKGKLGYIPGLCYKRNDGKPRISRQSAMIKDLNALPILNRRLIDYTKYVFQGSISTSLLASRGCSMGCRFCAIRETFRFRTAKHVMLEIEDAFSLGIRHFNFEDDTINLNPEFRPLLDMIIQRFSGRIKISFMNGLLASGIDRIMREKLIQAGLTHIDLAIASSQERLRKKLHRNDPTAKVFGLARFMGKKQIVPTIHYIVGFPGQAFEDGLRDIRLLAAKPALLGPSIFYPVKESALFSELTNLFSNSEDDYALFRSSAACFDQDISRDRIFSLIYFARIINFIKQLTVSTVIPDLRKFLRKQTQGYLIKEGQLQSKLKLDRNSLGKICLRMLLDESIIYRVEQSKKNGDCIYSFKPEEFVLNKDIRKALHELTVCGVGGGKMKIKFS
ncbi:MAG: B12-binding domain-containing radical SAM protein [Candidatus Omnitrophica bacterium]|nr:B12-binding domain-containing radical SAM protein [Candidatus Omnitrophota bacterium]